MTPMTQKIKLVFLTVLYEPNTNRISPQRNRRDAVDPMGVNRRNDSLPKSDRPNEREGLLLGNEGNAAAGKGNEALGDAGRPEKATTTKEEGAFARKWSIWAILAAFFLAQRRPKDFSSRIHIRDHFFPRRRRRRRRLESVHKDGDFSSRRGAADRVTY